MPDVIHQVNAVVLAANNTWAAAPTLGLAVRNFRRYLSPEERGRMLAVRCWLTTATLDEIDVEAGPVLRVHFPPGATTLAMDYIVPARRA